MAQQKLRDLGMDTMERLYYERQNARKKAYDAKRKKSSSKTKVSAKRHQIKEDSVAFERMIRENLYYNMESVC